MYEDCMFHINNNMPYEGFKNKISQKKSYPHVAEVIYNY